jgi:flagellin-specific chaperone FliS
LNYVFPATIKTAQFSLELIKEIHGLSDLKVIKPRATMNQVTKISKEIDGYFCDTNPELNFLFDSLLISLRTASRNAGSSSIVRAVPSIVHAMNLSTLLEAALLKIPIPSLCGHINDLFDYFRRTLEDNSHIPISGELDELIQLTIELREGINSLQSTQSRELKGEKSSLASTSHIV